LIATDAEVLRRANEDRQILNSIFGEGNINGLAIIRERHSEILPEIIEDRM